MRWQSVAPRVCSGRDGRAGRPRILTIYVAVGGSVALTGMSNYAPQVAGVHHEAGEGVAGNGEGVAGNGRTGHTGWRYCYSRNPPALVYWGKLLPVTSPAWLFPLHTIV